MMLSMTPFFFLVTMNLNHGWTRICTNYRTAGKIRVYSWLPKKKWLENLCVVYSLFFLIAVLGAILL